MESTPNKFTLRAKRRLATLYDESPNSEDYSIKMCELNTKEIKTALNFVDEDSTDSGFNDECYKSDLFENSFTTNLSELSNSFVEESIQVNSASKRMKIVNDKFIEFDIKKILEQEDQAHMLVGDKSKKHVLPVLQQSKHRDLASISSHTMADLLNGKYNDEIEQYIIIDARYPYEYEGGHIDNALNLYLKDQLFDYLFKHPIQLNDKSKRLVVIFHCEFSSERGPKLMREIRQRDRTINKNCYPNLHYPEIYLLEGGYKNFFESYSNNCLPKSYKPMLHDDHRNDLKFFRKKSKSWELENRRSRVCKSKFLEF